MLYFSVPNYETLKDQKVESDKDISSLIDTIASALGALGNDPEGLSNIRIFGSDSPIEDFSDLGAFTPDGRTHPFADRLKKAYPNPESKVEASQNKKQQNVDQNEDLEFYKNQCAHLSELLASVCEFDPYFYVEEKNNYYRLLEFHGLLFSWYTEYQLQNQSARRKANIEHYSAQFETLSDDGVMELVDKGILKDVYLNSFSA